MKRLLYLLALAVILLSSCKSHKYASSDRPADVGRPVVTTRPVTNAQTSDNISNSDLDRAARKLGFSVERSDNRRLMTESASWLGVRYKAGGYDRNGVDCSGLVFALYSSVFGQKFPRCSSADIYEKYCTKLNASQLKQGDLVFFTTDNSKGRIGHSGIYLKNGRFIHASSSKGVIISNLNEQYWSKHWYAGGKVK